MFRSGGGAHQGVGIVVSHNCVGSIQDISFHAYCPPVCSLTFRLANKMFVACACHMLTSWDTNAAVMEVYELLDLILYSPARVNRLPLIGRDLNACIGQMFPQNDLVSCGTCRWGTWDSTGSLLMQWVLDHGLKIFNRMKHSHFDSDSWTCQGHGDGSLVQIDFLIGAMAFQIQATWNDFAILIGLDHGPSPQFLLQEWVETSGTILGSRREAGSLLRFNPRCGNASLRAHMFRWKFLNIILMEAGLDGCTCSNIRFKY